ncbi:MAG TPA: hypothetical protein VJW76_04140 [Verrucomicrobiae bacterium]|nr:hypothetical protein [Verrucomicrobiae bacterium]
MPIREGLARLEGVESIGQRPNIKEGTCELRTKNGRLLDPEVLSKHIYNIRVGARLRGVEAAVAGSLDKQGDNFVLRVAGSEDVLCLVALSRKVQKDADRRSPLPEDNAFKTLLSKWTGKPLSVQITGPLIRLEGKGLSLAVRQFELKR